jgi:hypothetical protein
VTRNLFTVNDPDSDPADLRLSARLSSDQLPRSSSGGNTKKSGSKRINLPFQFMLNGKASNNFTMRDVDEGRVYFRCSLQANEGNGEGAEEVSADSVRIVLSVDDGKSSGSSTVLLRVSPFDLKLISRQDDKNGKPNAGISIKK